MPSSNPTTGLGVAAYVHVSGPTITNPAGGSDVHPGGYATPINGQGLGANAGSGFPVAQYALKLSLSGVGAPTAEALVASLVDVADNAVLTSEYYIDNFVWEAYCAPKIGSVGWYHPNNGSATGSVATTYDACVVTLGAPYGTYDVDCVVTANHVGQCIVEAQYPVFDNSLGDNTGYNPAEETPIMMIYAQIVVSVIP